jgi:hypothetical protein
MSDVTNSVWDETDASNNTAAPDGAPEGMAPSGVNNVLRAHQGALKRWYNWTVPKTTGGTSTAYTLSYGVAPGALVDGMTHLVQFNAVNGASPTLNVNSLGAKPLHFYCGGSWAALPAYMLGVDQLVRVAYHSSSGAYRCLDLPLLLRQTMSGSTLDFTGIPSNVSGLEIVASVKPSTNGDSLALRTYNATPTLDAAASDYNYLYFTLGSTSATPTPAGSAATTSSILLANTVSNGSGGALIRATAQDIQAAASAQVKFLIDSAYVNTSSVNIGLNGSGYRNSAARITGVRLLSGSGNWAGPVTVRLW